MTYECPCGCHIEIADLRRQLAEAQQARERAVDELTRFLKWCEKQIPGVEFNTLQDVAHEFTKRLNAANALLREAQCWIPDGSRRTPEQRGAKYETAGELAAAITAHLETK